MGYQMTKDEIKAAVSEAFEDHRREFWVDPEAHYLQHQFLFEMMGNAKVVKKYGIITITTVFVGYILKAIFFKA
jgi:hypothetical protein